MSRTVLLFVLLSMGSVSEDAQVKAADVSHSPPAQDDTNVIDFEEVSIRPSQSAGGWISKFTADGFEGDSVPLQFLLRLAFATTVAPPDILAVPEWAKDAYDIRAKISPDDLPIFKTYGREQQAIMLRRVLTQRFKLAFHFGTTTHEDLALSALGAADMKLRAHRVKDYSESGSNEPIMPESGGRLHFSAHPDNMAHLARRLSWTADAEQKMVVDNTRLEGFYDFDLTWCGYSENPEQAETCNGPALSTALKEQLGLQLKPSKATFKTVVIDHIEQPSPN